MIRERVLTVLNYFGGQDVMTNPDKGTVDSLEIGAHELHLRNSVLLVVDVDSISHVVWMLDEEEDAGEKDLLGGRSDQPGQTEDECTGGRYERSELGGDHGSEDQDDNGANDDHENIVEPTTRASVQRSPPCHNVEYEKS
jgi:hypothetical protein